MVAMEEAEEPEKMAYRQMKNTQLQVEELEAMVAKEELVVSLKLQLIQRLYNMQTVSVLYSPILVEVVEMPDPAVLMQTQKTIQKEATANPEKQG